MVCQECGGDCDNILGSCRELIIQEFLETLNDNEYENFMTQPEDIQREIISDWIMYNK